MSLNTILCPTDFGECAQGALQQALRLAQSHGARVHLLNVANAPRYVRRDMVGFLGSSGARPLNEIALEASDTRLKKLLGELPDELRGLVTPHARFGAPAATIAQFAVAHKADLIVMGSRGRSLFGRYLLGGVAGKVVRSVHCPVLCVPDQDARDFKRILVASDFSECSKDALHLASSVAKAARSWVTVAHATTSAWNLPAELQMGVPGQGTHWLELLQRQAREQLDDFVAKARAGGDQVDDQRLLIGSPAQSLLRCAHGEDTEEDGTGDAAHGYDLIVMGTHGRGAVARLMLGSVAETVVHHARVPVLTVRSNSSELPESESEA